MEQARITNGIVNLSYKSLHITMLNDGQPTGTGTGFIVKSDKGPALITNRHNVTGRDNITGEMLPGCSPPNTIRIAMLTEASGLEWEFREEELYDLETPLWFEHPVHKGGVDFIALVLKNAVGIFISPYNLNPPEYDSMLMPTSSISVIGFPFGLSSKKFLGIWATGFVATDPIIDYQDQPKFLIDCRARPGQSGSAVVQFSETGTLPMKTGGQRVFGHPVFKLLGIYSGRVNKESDLGIVWKTSAIKELIEHINQS